MNRIIEIGRKMQRRKQGINEERSRFFHTVVFSTNKTFNQFYRSRKSLDILNVDRIMSVYRLSEISFFFLLLDSILIRFLDSISIRLTFSHSEGKFKQQTALQSIDLIDPLMGNNCRVSLLIEEFGGERRDWQRG